MYNARAAAQLFALGVAIATAVVMLTTEPHMAIVWDEGYVLGREARLRDWFRGLKDPARFSETWRPLPSSEELVQYSRVPAAPRPEQVNSRWKLLFDHDVVAWFWPFAREEPFGHPPFFALLGLLGDLLVPWWSDLARARLGPILLFSCTAGVIFQFAAARWGGWAAALTAGAWVLQPNLFAHGHYAGYDSVLASLWILSIVVFAKIVESPTNEEAARSRWWWTVSFGVILGCAAATKLTGWFLPLPFLAWAGIYRSRRGFKAVVAGGLVAMLVVFALIPPWWTEPVVGLARFLRSNLSRGETIPISVLFLGSVYTTPTPQSLPWYNTLVWTLFVTPVGFLVMAILGFWAALRSWRGAPIGPLIIGHWTLLMMLRALPHTPGHDGVRLFLPAFGMLALLAGRGGKLVLENWGRWAKALIAAATIEGAASLALMMPVPLSYFSPLVGGLPGAAALGMEPTYYWDALNPAAREWLARNTLAGRTYTFSGFPHSWLYLRRTGELPRRLAPVDSGLLQWVVLQNRPGAFSDVDRMLVAHGRPALTVAKLGVPLVWIFPVSEVERVATGRGA
jgi:4-amino-4-deoxy-L-arabinose transferase-like glycosyltransferase